MEIQKEFQTVVDTYKTLSGRMQEKLNNQTALQKVILDLQEQQILYTDALEVLEAANHIYQKAIFTQVDTLLTEALRVICEDDNVSIQTELSYKNGQPTATFLYKDGTTPEGVDLLYAHGGGIVNIMSTALRLIVAELMKIQGFIAFDEPFSMLHSYETNYEANAVKFLKEFSHRCNKQLILITHSSSVAAIGDKSFVVSKVDKVSGVEAGNVMEGN